MSENLKRGHMADILVGDYEKDDFCVLAQNENGKWGFNCHKLDDIYMVWGDHNSPATHFETKDGKFVCKNDENWKLGKKSAAYECRKRMGEIDLCQEALTQNAKVWNKKFREALDKGDEEGIEKAMWGAIATGASITTEYQNLQREVDNQARKGGEEERRGTNI